MERVNTVEEIQKLAWARRSVYCECFGNMGNRRLPAAVVINMQAGRVLQYINEGMFIYEPKRKTG